MYFAKDGRIYMHKETPFEYAQRRSRRAQRAQAQNNRYSQVPDVSPLPVGESLVKSFIDGCFLGAMLGLFCLFKR